MSRRRPRSWHARDQRVEVVERPELGRDARVVGDVVAEVGERARVDRAQPDRVHAQGGIGPAQVVEAAEDAGEVADAVAVRIGEGARVDLVEDAPSHHRSLTSVDSRAGTPDAVISGARHPGM